MSRHAQTYDQMLAHLQSVAKELVTVYGYSSIQILGCVQMDGCEESTALFTGAGSYHERCAVAREFVIRGDEFVKQQARSIQ